VSDVRQEPVERRSLAVLHVPKEKTKDGDEDGQK
jgi:hypothetical protein